MTETMHTPGPWLRSGNTVYALNPDGFNRFCAQVQDAHTPNHELEANARLMAAAPKLLSALVALEKEFRAVFPIYYYSEPWAHDNNVKLAEARAVIAKAIGES